MANSHLQKLLKKVEKEKAKLQRLGRSSDVIEEKLTLIRIIEGFCNLEEAYDIDEENIEKLIKAFEKFDKLNSPEEKKFMHSALHKTLSSKESDAHIHKRLDAFHETINAYEEIIHTLPESKEHHEQAHIKKKHLTDNLLHKLEEGISVYEMSKSVIELGHAVGLSRLLPLAIFL